MDQEKVILRLSLVALCICAAIGDGWKVVAAGKLDEEGGLIQRHAHRKVLASFDMDYPPAGPSTPGGHDSLPNDSLMLVDMDYPPSGPSTPGGHDSSPNDSLKHVDDSTPVHSNPAKVQDPSAPLAGNSRLPLTSTEGAGLNVTTPDDPLIGSVSIVNKLPTLMHVHCRNADDSIDLTYLTVQKDATYHFDVQQNMTGPTIYWCFLQYAGSSNFHQEINVWTDGPVFGTVKCVDCIWSAQETGIFVYDDQTQGDPLVNAYQWLAW